LSAACRRAVLLGSTGAVVAGLPAVAAAFLVCLSLALPAVLPASAQAEPDCDQVPPPPICDPPPGGNTAPRVTLQLISPSPAFRGQTVTFEASAVDDEGNTVSFAWDLDGDGATDDATGAIVSRSYATLGNVTIKVRGSDGSLARSDTAILSIVNRLPTAAFTVVPSAPMSGDAVQFDSTTSSDADGTVQSRAWDLDDDGAFDDGTGVTASRSFALPGRFTVRLRVTDNDGAATARAVTVAVGNRLPTASFSVGAPAPVAGDAIAFDASASADPEGTALSYEWDFDGDGSFEATTTTPNTFFAYGSAGTYAVRLRVSDAHGGTAETTQSLTVAPRTDSAGGGSPAGGSTGGGSPGGRLPKLDVGIGYRWSVAGGRTRVVRLTLRRLPTGANVVVTCTGGGCALKTKALVATKPNLSLVKLFKKRKLRAGAVIEVRVTMPGFAGKAFRYTTQKGRKLPRGGPIAI
jgi:PKD repeat protein